MVKPKPDRPQGILDFNLQKTKKQLQGFMGLVDYDRDFILKLSEKTRKLYELITIKHKYIKWDESLIEQFKEIKQHWAKEMRLYLPNKHQKYVLESDASDTGLGCTLR